jgi:hypothetical protein
MPVEKQIEQNTMKWVLDYIQLINSI